MKTYTASDFIHADITITRIHSVEHTVTKVWSRPTKRPRDCEGLLYFVSGTIDYDFGDYTFRASPGQVLKLPANIPYNGKKADADPLEYYLLDFDALPGEFARFPIPDAFTPTDGEAIIRTFEMLIELRQQHTLCSGLELKNAAAALLCSLAKDFAVTGCHYDDRSHILKICEYIKQHFTDPELRIPQIAEHFHISPAHLRRIFAAELHLSPSEYIAALRIERAKSMLLSHADLDISGIAYACGYASVYYFSSAFRSAVGLSPSRYRLLCMDQSGKQ